MILDFFRGIHKKGDLTESKYNGDWRNLISFWNQHNSGVVKFDNISFGVSTTTKTANYTALSTDQLVLMDTTSSALTLTLPSASGIKGKEYIVMNVGTKMLTIAPNGSDTINGGAFTFLPTKYYHTQLWSDGTNWVAI